MRCCADRMVVMKTIIVILSIEEYGKLLGVVEYAFDKMPENSEQRTALRELKNTLENSMKVQL